MLSACYDQYAIQCLSDWPPPPLYMSTRRHLQTSRVFFFCGPKAPKMGQTCEQGYPGTRHASDDKLYRHNVGRLHNCFSRSSTNSYRPTSLFQEYGKVHQHGGCFAFLEIAASKAISATAIMHLQCF